MRYLILLTLVCFVFPISAANSIETSRLQGDFMQEIHTLYPRFIRRRSDVHNEWLRLFTYDGYSDSFNRVVVVQCTCLEDDLFFDDYMGVIRTVGFDLANGLDNILAICKNSFDDNGFAEFILAECFPPMGFLLIVLIDHL